MPESGEDVAGILEARNIKKSIRRRPIVRDVSLRLERGEIVGILGPNGAGKSTCFYMIAGLLAPDSGEVLIDGEDVTELPMYRRARLGLGYLPQEVSVFRGLSVEDNIMAVLEFRERDRAARRRRLDELLKEFSITHLRTAKASLLSGGERRRVEIARCLASQPSYILLDEPFAGIDPIVVGDVRRLVRELKDRNIGVLITDHNARDALALVDRVYVMFEGAILTHGPPSEVANDRIVRRVYLGDDYGSA